ncbi:hypothetical protein [Rhizobium leguminosarum]|uniref:hypothetical protein n=1 Tax=Rhizobium leguminosarum TaxID=384 RepID=UPI00103005D4|nr:hypothetical protein [Rhizobium leguminosarum]TAV81570.1 hypothetical protein ELI22_34005 [Rhizobium leguminosarum]TAV94176.1 hypothetical protein ELI21_10400 [Rhizobium leguminosarum]TAW35251.1 hypothetical protein ELI23_10440 [Rhizobium leguminosarum]
MTRSANTRASGSSNSTSSAMTMSTFGYEANISRQGTAKGQHMFDNPSAEELQLGEDDIFIKYLERKWTLDTMGIPPTHDKAFCFYRWQLDEIEEAKARLVRDGCDPRSAA